MGKLQVFPQIYIYDDKELEPENHLNSFCQLNRNLLKELQDMMTEVNPYAQIYCHIGNVIKEKPTENVQFLRLQETLLIQGDTTYQLELM